MSGSQHETPLDLWPQKMFLQKKKEEGIKITNGWTRWRRSKLTVNRYSSQTTHQSIGILYHDKAEICFPTWMIPGLKPTKSRPPLPNTQPVSSSPPCLCPLPQHPLHLLTQAVSKVPHEVQVTQELHLLLAQRIPTGPRSNMPRVSHVLCHKWVEVGWGVWMRRSGALDAFAQGDASRLPIQGSTIHHGPKLRRTIWSYRSGTNEKIHLKCQEGVQGGAGEGTCAFVF